MIRTIKTHVLSRRNLSRALVIPATFLAIAACNDANTVTGPTGSTASADPSFAKGGAAAGKAETFGARAYGRVIPNDWEPTLDPNSRGVVSVTRAGALYPVYCLTLSPSAFPDPSTAIGVVTTEHSSGQAYWTGIAKGGDPLGMNCPSGTVVVLLDGSSPATTGFTFIIM